MRCFLFLALILAAPPAWAQNPVSYLQIPPKAADPFTCDSTRYGAVYRNTVGDIEYVCRSTGWKPWGTGSVPGFPILAPAGSAGAPSYSWSGDPNTGIYSISDGKMGFSFNSSLRFTMSTVAIGVEGNRFLCFNSEDYPCFQFATNQTPDAFTLQLPAVSRTLLLMDGGAESSDHAFPAQTHATIVLFGDTTTGWASLTHNATQPVLATGKGPYAVGSGAAVASAATVEPSGNLFHVTGTTTITAITARAAGTCITLIFDGVLTVTDDGGALNTAGNFVTTANDTLGLCSDGTNWYETHRSIN